MKIHTRVKYVKSQENCENFIKFYRSDGYKNEARNNLEFRRCFIIMPAIKYYMYTRKYGNRIYMFFF